MIFPVQKDGYQGGDYFPALLEAPPLNLIYSHPGDLCQAAAPIQFCTTEVPESLLVNHWATSPSHGVCCCSPEESYASHVTRDGQLETTPLIRDLQSCATFDVEIVEAAPKYKQHKRRRNTG